MFDRRLRFYATTALLGYGIAWASGIYLTLIGFRGSPAECSLSCLWGAVPDSLGWLLVSVCGYRAFKVFFTVHKEKRAESLDIGHGLEEEHILEITREILAHRRVAKRLRKVEALAWSDTQSWYWLRFKWQGYRKPSMLVVASGLRGRLEPEDWRTYLNWHYLRHKPRQTLYVAQPFIRAMLPLLLLAAIGVNQLVFFGQQASELFGAVFLPPTILLFVYLFGSAMKKVFLRLDSVASESLGNGTLLSLFNKIDSLHLPDSEKAKKREGLEARLWPEPNISERISNLANRVPFPERTS